jgi:hypothetical protein
LYSGARCEPVYPATQAYARAILLLYYPWHGHFHIRVEEDGLMGRFNKFIRDNANCPKSVRLAYDRARIMKSSKEPTSKTADIDYAAFAVKADDETSELVALVSTIFAVDAEACEELSTLDFGRSMDWSKPLVEVSMEVVEGWLSHDNNEANRF